MPVYAKDILKVGPTGLGWLEAAPAAGALLMAVVMAHRPPLKHAGRDLLVAVTGFGVATIVFGISRNFWVSLSMLFLTGALDNISVIVRHTLVQMLTPDKMRGRVSAAERHVHRRFERVGGLRIKLGRQFFHAHDLGRLGRCRATLAVVAINGT